MASPLLNPRGVYVILGSSQGIASALLPVMQDWGAHNFVFLSKTETAAPNVNFNKTKNTGLNIRECTDQFETASDLRDIFESFSQGGSQIKGIIYDGTLDSKEDGPTEIRRAAILHEATAKMHLDFVVSFTATSVDSPFPNSNAVDVIAQHRAASGLPFLAIDIAGDTISRVDNGGYINYPDRTLLVSLLESAIRHPVRTSGSCHLVVRNQSPKASVISSPPTTTLTNEASKKSRTLVTPPTTPPPTPLAKPNNSFKNTECKNGETNLRNTLSSAVTIGEAIDELLKELLSKMERVLATEKEDLDLDSPLGMIGVDSLIAADVCNWLVAEADCKMTTFELVETESLKHLASFAAGRSGVVNLNVEGEA